MALSDEVTKSWWSLLGATLVICLHYSTPGVWGEPCAYERSVYDPYTNTYFRPSAVEDCQWGCCSSKNSPCCTMPMTLIVGCILGGLGLFVLVAAAILCLVYSRKRAHERRAREGRRTVRPPRHPHPHHDLDDTTDVFYSESSLSMSEPPPSYEEVMRVLADQGQSNPGFKADDESV